MIRNALELVERGLVPDLLTRKGIQRLLKKRLNEKSDCIGKDQERTMAFVKELKNSPIALHSAAANEQHYEVPPEFFQLVLGKKLKYSACYYPEGSETLDLAEEKMLTLTCERAGITDGMAILELGCGWGALTLWMAEKYPASSITAVSNSTPQKLFIQNQCEKKHLKNVTVITCDMNDFPARENLDNLFDRVVSVEMFEHMRNYKLLFHKISKWLKPDGRLFFHIFTHENYAYPFNTKSDDDWMGRHFFTGGIMPSDDLILYFQDDMVVENHWRMNGRHYAKTSEHWLNNLDRHKDAACKALSKNAPKMLAGEIYDATRQFHRWRMFFMSCAELFAYDQGRQWGVSHYLYRNRRQ